MKSHPSKYCLLYLLASSTASCWLIHVTAEIQQIGGGHCKSEAPRSWQYLIFSFLLVKQISSEDMASQDEGYFCWPPLQPGVAMWLSAGQWDGWMDMKVVWLTTLLFSLLHHPFLPPKVWNVDTAMLDHKNWSLKTSWNRQLTSSILLSC